jgi:hypothetical protein
MRNSITTPCVLFLDLFNRPLRATFEAPNASSEGGAVLLKAADRRLGLIPRLAEHSSCQRAPKFPHLRAPKEPANDSDTAGEVCVHRGRERHSPRRCTRSRVLIDRPGRRRFGGGVPEHS